MELKIMNNLNPNKMKNKKKSDGELIDNFKKWQSKKIKETEERKQTEDKLMVNSINYRLGILRKRNKLTQIEFAKLCGLGAPTTVASWEKGRSGPKVETLPILSKIFNVSIDYLVTGRQFQQVKKD